MKKLILLTALSLIICIKINVSAQTVINLSVSQPPVLVSDAGIDTFIYLEDSVQIGGLPTADGGTQPYFYTWTPATKISDPTAANPIVYPGATTTYNLKVTDYNSCTSNSSVKVKVSGLGISEKPNIDMQVFPNPGTGIFSLDLNGNISGTLKLEILNDLGQIIITERIENLNGNYKTIINISKYDDGLYIVRLTGKNVNIIKRLIVK